MKKIVLFSLLLCYALSSWAANSSFLSRTDFRDESIYFVMTTRFYNGDPGNDVQCWDAQNYNVGDPAWRGDFKGLIEKMDYIKALGFTAIWVTPIVENASGYDYHGYHAHDFSKVDHRYESEGVSFQQVIEEAHKRGMKVILDIVLNHTGNFGEANLCKLFTRDWTKDQSMIDECMVPLTKKNGGKLPDNYLSLPGGEQYSARLSQMKNTTGVNYDVHNYWHHFGHGNWDDPSRWWMQIAGDCVDLNTEHPYVYNYLIECYSKFIKMGLDGFRIDTGGHIPRLTFNQAFIPAFQAAAESAEAKSKRGNMPFYMFAEVCARYTGIWYREQPNLSPLYYTWKENKTYAWDENPASWDNIVALEGDKCDTHTNHESVQQSASDASKPTSQNAFLNGNNYRTPDYSKASGLNVIDFTMHHNFRSAGEAWNIAQQGNDQYYNDATWNVVYVDSHDYAPNGAPEDKRFSGDESTLAENWSLMFTHRGVPCIYYGSEIQFKKGCVIDKGPNEALKNTGRAYFGGYIKGNATVTDFATYTNATGNMAATLSHPLAKHVQRLNKIRQAVPALRKGQYSMDGCNGSFAFKRRYTDANTDSYALVCISGGATFSNVLNGKYTDCVTGEVINVTNGTLKANCSGKGNLRVFVLDTEKTKAPGKVGEDGKYIYKSSSVAGSTPKWDGTEEELDDRFGQGGNGGSTDWGEAVEPCVESATERAVFFQATQDFGTSAAVYMWIKGTTTNLLGAWPGQRATHLGGGTFKFVLPDNVTGDESQWMIIWNNNNNGKQTKDFSFTMRGLYDINEYKNLVTKLCEGGNTGEQPGENPGSNPGTSDPVEEGMCLASASERAVFFTKPSGWGSNINCYVWINGGTADLLGKWPGAKATNVGGNDYKMVIPESAGDINSNWMIIWNDGSNQTNDLQFVLHGLWTGNDRNSIKQTGTITEICEENNLGTDIPEVEYEGDGWYYDILGRRYEYPTHPGIYIRNGVKILVK